MALSRRKLMLMGLGAGVAVGVPAVRHLSWGAQDFTDENLTRTLPQPPKGETRWTNWSGLQSSTPKQIAVPKTTEELAEIVRQAKGFVRPVGSGHSFTALVPSEDTIVDVSRFSGVTAHDVETQTVTVGAGSRLRSVARDLDKLGLAFANMPDVDVQTMAGSFNTATHGAGLSLKAIHDYTIGFKMVTAEGDVKSVTKASDPELFSAGLVSLGALGVITEYTLKVEKAFKLNKRVVVEPLEDVLDKMLDMAKNHLVYEFFYLPSSGYAVSLISDVTDEPIRKSESKEDENQILWDLKKARDMFGWAPSMRRKLVASALPKGEIENQVDKSWRLLSTARPIKFNEMEYHVPIEHADIVLREVLKRLDARKDVFFPVEVRFVAQDDAWLSPFSQGPTISIALHALAGENFDYLFKEFEPFYNQYNGRPHWGKLHSRKRTDFTKLYPKFDDFKDIRSTLDPTGKFLNPHLRDVFGLVKDV